MDTRGHAVDTDPAHLSDLSNGLEPVPVALLAVAAPVDHKYVTDSILPDGTPLAQAPFPPAQSGSEASSSWSSDEELWTCDCVGETEGGDALCGVTDGDTCECVGSFGNFYSSPAPSRPQVLLLDVLPERLPLVECAASCACGLACANRVTQGGIRTPIAVRPTPTGLGAFYTPRSSEPLPKGSFVCLYVGEYLTTDQAHERWSQRQADNYILSFRQPTETIHIDARRYSNVARYLNHSCEPNCVILVVRLGGGDGWPRLAIFAKRDVGPGEEMTYDYANASGGPLPVETVESGQGDGRTKCLCGAKRCRGWMPFDESL